MCNNPVGLPSGNGVKVHHMLAGFVPIGPNLFFWKGVVDGMFLLNILFTAPCCLLSVSFQLVFKTE